MKPLLRVEADDQLFRLVVGAEDAEPEACGPLCDLGSSEVSALVYQGDVYYTKPVGEPQGENVEVEFETYKVNEVEPIDVEVFEADFSVLIDPGDDDDEEEDDEDEVDTGNVDSVEV